MSYLSEVLADAPWGLWRLNDSPAPSGPADSGSAALTYRYGRRVGPGASPLVGTGKAITGGNPGNVANLDFAMARSTTIPASLAGSNVTAAMWVSIPAGNTSGQFVSLGNGSNGWGVGIGSSNFDTAGRKLILLDEGVAWRVTSYTFPAGAGTYHIVVVRTGSSFTAYVNGVSVYTGNHSPSTPTSQVSIGGGGTSVRSLSPLFTMDEVSLYSTSLSAARVTAQYNGGAGDSSAIATDAPVSWLKFDELLAEVVVEDSSGNGRSLTTAGAPPTIVVDGSPKTGHGVYGSAGGVLESSAISSQPLVFTYEAWVKLAATPSQDVVIVTADGNDTVGMSTSLEITSAGKAQLRFYDGATNYLLAPTSLSLNVWHHLVASVGAAGAKLRVDKNTVTTNPITAIPARQDGRVVIHSTVAAQLNLSAQALEVAEVAVYLSQLSDTRTDAHYDVAPDPITPSVGGNLTSTGNFSASAYNPSATYTDEVMSDAPGVYLKLDETSGSATAADFSGNGRNAAHLGGVTTGLASLRADGVGQSASHNGTNGYTVVTYGSWLNTESFTVDMLIVAPPSTGDYYLATRWEYSGAASLLFNVSAGRLYGRVAAGNNWNVFEDLTGATLLTPGQIYHVAIVFTGATRIDLYVNGVLDATRTSSVTILSPTADLRLGQAGGGAYSAQRMDEVAWYPTALPVARIAAHATKALSSGIPAVSAPLAGVGSFSALSQQVAVRTASFGGSGTFTATVQAVTPGSYSTEVLADAPLGYWRLDEASGAIAVDSSGGDRDMAYSGGITLGVPGIVSGGTAAQFDGSTGRVQMASAAWMDVSTLTLEAWVKTTSVLGQSVIDRHGGSGGPFQFRQESSGAVSFLRVFNASNNFSAVSVTGSVPVNDGAWHHLVATYDGATAKVYVDGALDASGPISGGMTTSISSPLALGVNNGNGTGQAFFTGDIDEAAYYGTVLSAARIAAHYEAGTAAAAPGIPSVSASLSGTGTFTATSTQVSVRPASLMGSGTFTATSAVVSALPLADTFNRANSTTSLGSTTTGSIPWQPLSGTWGIKSNRAYVSAGPSNTVAVAVVETGASDCTVQATVPETFAGSSHSGLALRMVSSGNGYILEDSVGPGSGNMTLYKGVGGSYTVLGTAAGISFVDGDTVTAVLSGPSIVIKVNGTTRISVEDSTYLTATKHGLYHVASSGVPGIVEFDDFSVTSAGVPSVTATLTGTGAFTSTSTHVLVRAAALAGAGAFTASVLPVVVTSYEIEVLADSPLVYYRMGEAVGSTVTMSDSSGNFYNGSYLGGAILGAPGIVLGDDTSVDFDGSAAYASTNAEINVPTISVEAWVKPETLGSTMSVVNRDFGTGERDWSLRVLSDGRVEWTFWVAASQTIARVITSNTLLGAGQGYHLVATYDGTISRLYINGAEDNSLSITGELRTWGANSPRVGRAASSAAEFWNGTLDEVAIYSGALTAARVNTHYVVGSGDTAPVIPARTAALTGIGNFTAVSAQVGGVPAVAASLSGVGNLTALVVIPGDLRDSPLSIGGVEGELTLDLPAMSTEVGESLPAGVTKTAWLEYTPPGSSSDFVRFLTPASGTLRVYDSVGSLVASDDDGSASIRLPSVSYEIQVGTSGDEAVVFSWLDATPEIYDDFNYALEINSDYGSEYITLVNGTLAAGEVAPVGTVATSWVTFTAEETTLINFSFAGDPSSTAYAVVAYSGSPLQEAGSVSGIGQTSLALNIIEGETYWLQLSSTTDLLDLQLVWNIDPTIVEPSQDAESIRAEVYERDGLTLITEVPKRTGVTFQEALNVTGAGEMTLRLDADIIDQYPQLLAFGNVVKFWLGTRCVHGFRISNRKTSWVTTEEWSGMTRTVSGPSVQYLMEDFMVLHDAQKLQDRALDTRSFNWASRRGEWYDAADWDGPYNVSSQAEPPSEFEKPFNKRAKYNNPKNWPDPEAKWMWVSNDPALNEGNFNPPPLRKTRYFRKQFTTSDSYQLVKLFASADEKYQVFLDGEEILSGDGVETGYTEFQKRKFVLKSGVHTLAIVQTSQNQTKADGADAVIFSLMKIDTKGRPTKVILNSGEGWETTYLRPAPSWNRAQVLRAVVNEAKNRNNNSALHLSLGFTGDRDSANRKWLDKFNQDVPIGTSALALQGMLSESGQFDVWVDPLDLEIKAWRRRGRDLSKSVTLEPGRNLMNWEVDEVENVKNRFLIQYDGGWTTWKAGYSVQIYGDREAFLTIGAARDDKAAEGIVRRASRGLAQAELRAGTSDIVKRKEGTPTGGLIAVPGARPFLDFGVGDTVKAPNARGILKPHRVLALTLTEDENGELSYDPELEEVR